MTTVEQINYMIQSLQVAKDEIEYAEKYIGEKNSDKEFYQYGHLGYDNRTPNFGTTNYENVLTERWQLYSGRLTDQQSKLMHHLINSTYVYLYDIQADKFTPVVITDTEMEYKTYKNNNNKMVYYTINVEASQTKYRR